MSSTAGPGRREQGSGAEPEVGQGARPLTVRTGLLGVGPCSSEPRSAPPTSPAASGARPMPARALAIVTASSPARRPPAVAATSARLAAMSSSAKHMVAAARSAWPRRAVGRSCARVASVSRRPWPRWPRSHQYSQSAQPNRAADSRFVHRETALDRRGQVGVLGVDPGEPGDLPAVAGMRRRVLREGEEVVGVRAARRIPLAGGREPATGRTARPVRAAGGRVGVAAVECVQPATARRAPRARAARRRLHRAGPLPPPPPGRRAGSRRRRPTSSRSSACSSGRADRSSSRGWRVIVRAARAGHAHRRASVVEPSEQRGGVEETGPGRGQLQSQRYAGQADADGRDRAASAAPSPSPGETAAARSSNRLTAGSRAASRRSGGAGSGRRQRLHRHLDFASHSERCPTRD